MSKINEVMDELNLPWFTQSDFTFFEEYIDVMTPIATALDNLQRSECYYGIFLPTLYTVRNSFRELKKHKFVYCQPLFQIVSNTFQQRFQRFFDLDDEQCQIATIAACTIPHFKMRWIEEEILTSSYAEKIEKLMISAINELNLPSTTPGSNPNPHTQNENG